MIARDGTAALETAWKASSVAYRRHLLDQAPDLGIHLEGDRGPAGGLMAIDYAGFRHAKGLTKLDRAVAKKGARLLDALKLRTWARAVKERDRWTDRKTGVRALMHPVLRSVAGRSPSHRTEVQSRHALRRSQWCDLESRDPRRPSSY